MANNELNFSVRLQMLTDQFNQNLRQAQSAFASATQSIVTNTADLRTNSTRAEQALSTLFSAPSNDLTATIQRAVTQLNGLTRGANISEEQMQQAFTVAARHVQTLSNDLDQARARLQNMTLAGASLTSIQQAQTEIAQLETRLQQAQTASTNLGTAMSSALNRASQTAQQTEASIDRLFGVRSNTAINDDINAISRALDHLQTEFEQGRISQQEFNRMTQAGQARLQALQGELTGTANAVHASNAGFAGLNGNVRGVFGALTSLQGLLGTIGVSVGAMEIIQLADDFKNLESRVRLATGAGVDFENGFSGVKDIANETRQSLESTGELFAKITQATKDLATPQKDILTITKAINQAIIVSGASAEAASAGIMQMSQGLAGGIIRAEEYNSIMENMPRVMQAAADGMGMSMGEIRQYMLDGKLTAEDFLKAIQSQAGVLQAEFDSMPVTFSQSIQVLKNNFMLLIGDMDKTLQSSSGLSQGIMDIADNLENIDPTIISALEQNMQALWQVVSTTAATLVDIYNSFGDLLDIVAGVDDASEKVGFFTRTLQGISIVIGTIADGIKGIEIIFDAVIGAAFDLGSAIAKAWSMITFGDVSARFAKAADDMKTKSNEFLAKFQKDTAEFKSSAVAALDEAAKTQQQRLDETAQAAEKAYLKMAEDGKASAGQQQEAFLKYAKEAIAANNGIISERLKAQAVEAGVQLAVSKTGDVTAEAMQKPIDPAEKLQQTQKDIAAANEVFGTGMSKNMSELATHIVETSGKFDEFADAGVNASNMLIAGLTEMSNKASNTYEIQHTIDLWTELGKQGKIAGQDLADGLELARRKLDELTPGINSVNEAYKLMGLQTKKQLAEQATDFTTAYKLIEKDGTASASQLQQAFERYAKASVAANGDVVSSQLKSQAAAQGLVVEVDKNGRVSVQRADEVVKANDRVNTSMSRVTNSASNIGSAVESSARQGEAALNQLNNKLGETERRNQALQAQWDAESKQRQANNLAAAASINSDFSQYSTLTGIENFLKSAGLEQAKAMEEARKLMSQYGKNGTMNWALANGFQPGQTMTTQDWMRYKTPSEYLLQIAERERYRNVTQQNLPPVYNTPSIGGQGAPSGTIDINLRINGTPLTRTGNNTYTINAEDLLRQIEQSQALSGR